MGAKVGEIKRFGDKSVEMVDNLELNLLKRSGYKKK